VVEAKPKKFWDGGEQLLAHIDCGWNLLQQWNTISKSYKAKYHRVWDRVAETEEDTKQLIQELSSREP
jgi:hypothetical protein